MTAQLSPPKRRDRIEAAEDPSTVAFMNLAPMTDSVRSEVLHRWEDLLDGGQFIGGPAVERFEGEWAAYCGTSHCVGVGNGTDALRLTLTAAGIGPGDEVIMPANTFIATAEAVVLAGARPRFVDVDPDSLLVQADTVAAAINAATKAVIAVHLYGQMPDMVALCALGESAGVLVLEDAAQAHGAQWLGRPAGSFGHAACFSFYPGKNLGAFGDAGAIVTSDAPLAARVRSLRDHGRANGRRYEHSLVGTNSRLDALQAAVLSAKLSRLDTWNEARRRIAGRYRLTCAGTSLATVAENPSGRGVHHLAVVRVAQRSLAQRLLTRLGVQTAIHYPVPCHLSAPYRKYATGSLPVAERAAGQVLSLPMHPHLDDEQVDRVCAALRWVDDRLRSGTADG